MHFKAIAAAVLVMAAPVTAHPKLVSATPAPNATVAPTTRVQVTFSEALLPDGSGADIVMTGMPGMDSHPPMKMAAKVNVSPDRKTMTLTLAKPLPKGTYRLDWHGVSADTHQAKGSYAFKVA
ncbi:copper homeostasis periplasmic binding protein CopC [Sphingomonas spermidinifaciens]